MTDEAIVYVRLRGFPGDRVPAVRFPDGRRAQGTRPLARALDVVQPEPRLVPDDPRVEEAERWSDDVLQQWARRMVVEAGIRDPDLLHDRANSGRLGPLLTGGEGSRKVVVRLVKRAYRMTPEQLREDQTRVDEMLGRVDGLIAEGVLNGESLRRLPDRHQPGARGLSVGCAPGVARTPLRSAHGARVARAALNGGQ